LLPSDGLFGWSLTRDSLGPSRHQNGPVLWCRWTRHVAAVSQLMVAFAVYKYIQLSWTTCGNTF